MTRLIGSLVSLKTQNDTGALAPFGYPFGPPYSTVAWRTNTGRPGAWTFAPGTAGWMAAVCAICPAPQALTSAMVRAPVTARP